MRGWSLLRLLFVLFAVTTTPLAALDIPQQIAAAANATYKHHASQLTGAEEQRFAAELRANRNRFNRERRAAQRAAHSQELAERRAAQQILQKVRNYRRLVVQPSEVRRAAEKLTTQLDWQDDLAVAQKIAQRTGKPILWVQALGELRGVL